MEKPTSVKVIGGAWIGIGSLFVVSSLMAGAIYWMTGKTVGAGDAAGASDFTGRFFAYFPYLVVLQLFLGGVGIVAAIEFLRLEPWARGALEALAWFTVLLITTTQVWSITQVIGTSDGDSTFAMFFVATAVFYLIPCVFMIRALRGERIRKAFCVRPPTP